MLKRGYQGIFHKISPSTWIDTSLSLQVVTI